VKQPSVCVWVCRPEECVSEVHLWVEVKGSPCFFYFSINLPNISLCNVLKLNVIYYKYIATVLAKLYLSFPCIFVNALTVCARMTSYHECMNFPLVCILCLPAGWRPGSPGRQQLYPGRHGWSYSDPKETAPQFQATPQRLRFHPPGVVHGQTAAQEPRQGAWWLLRTGCH